MRKRNVEILTSLLNNPSGELKIACLTEKYSISERTLKNEVKNINEFLAQNGCGSVITLENKKIRIPENISRREIFHAIAQEERRSYILLPEEREELQMVFLIKARDYTTFHDLADRLNVSRLTIANDISALKRKMEQRGITVKSCKGKGVILEYEERSARKILTDILMRNFLGRLEAGCNAFQRLLLETMGFPYSLPDFSKEISMFECLRQNKFSDEEHDKVAIFMFVCFGRMAAGFFSSEPAAGAEQSGSTAVGELYEWLSGRFQQEPIKEEKEEADAYGRTLVQLRSRFMKENDPQKNQTFVFDLLLRLSDELGVELYQDKILADGLQNHFAERSGTAGEMIWGDWEPKGQRRLAQKDIYAGTEKILGELAASYRIGISQEDMSRISAYIISSIERMIAAKSDIKILVVCTNGVAVSQLLASEIRKYFAFDIRGTCPVRDIYQYEGRENIDFIISTVTLYNVGTPFVVVSPLLAQEDINKIYDMGWHILRERKGRDGQPSEIDTAFRNLEKLVKNKKNTAQAQALKEELERLVHRFGAEGIKSQPVLSRMFEKPYVQSVLSCPDWEQALRLAARPLAEDGMIKETYIEAMIENCRENGPYFVLREGLAAAHAAPDKGIIEPCLSLLYVREGVDFHHELFGKVRFLFCLCFRESGGMNLQILQALINFIEEKQLVDKAESAADSGELYQIICQYLSADEERQNQEKQPEAAD